VDHNHATGANRGLLCDACNKAAGFLRDSQELTLRLLVYFRTHDGPSFKPYVPDNFATREAREKAWEESFAPDTLPVADPPAAESLSVCEQPSSELG
jgi:hypothetical protein